MASSSASGPEETQTDEVLRAITEPNRRAILRLVANEEMAAGEIAAHFVVTRPAISQHLTVLREAGLVSERRAGTRRLYRARPEGLAELTAFLATLWPDALGRFKARAEATTPERVQGRDRMPADSTGETM
jgi:DNA-binding transcriptional ArsR family regulator